MTLTLPAHTLRSVATALRQLSYVPTSWQGLLAGMGADGRSQLEPLLVQLVREGAQPRLMALVLEQLAEQQELLQQERDAWSFVWSGADPLHARTADTFATVDQLLNQAQHHLMIATYNIGQSGEFKELLATLAQRLASRELQQVQLFFHPVQLLDQLGPDPMATISQWFFGEVWPWAARPTAYIDSRLLQGGRTGGSQHAKVVLADPGTPAAQALVTSANFSEAAQRHNFEAGWLLRTPWRVDQVHQHFQKLVAEGWFVPVVEAPSRPYQH
jgi:phosphatidylserine/phosphatidylglycerophosphate/cardiolipin synthase-like enzyme